MADASDKTSGAVKRLYFVCVSTPARPVTELEASLQAHKAYLRQLEAQGKLFAAGPLLGDSAKFTGLLVFRVGLLSEAELIAKNDPFHHSGLRTYTLTPWQVNEGCLDVRLPVAEEAL